MNRNMIDIDEFYIRLELVESKKFLVFVLSMILEIRILDRYCNN